MGQRSTIVVEKGGIAYKIGKVWFGSDGSYYVTMPYHEARTAFLDKRTIRYDTGFARPTRSSDTIEVSLLDDDEHRLKLSHHPDGFCQFSGHGVLSGKDEEGRIRGVGVQSRALSAINVRFGPMFILVLYGLEGFQRQREPSNSDIVISYDVLAPYAEPVLPTEPEGSTPAPGITEKEGMVIEAFYFQPEMRRLIDVSPAGRKLIYMPHPTGIIIPLTVLLSPETCRYPGFLGFYACRQRVEFPSDSGFSINGPAENRREDSYGRQLGDVIACTYPRPDDVSTCRSISFPQRPPAP